MKPLWIRLLNQAIIHEKERKTDEKSMEGGLRIADWGFRMLDVGSDEIEVEDASDFQPYSSNQIVEY